MLLLVLWTSQGFGTDSRAEDVNRDSSAVFLLVRALPDSIMLRWAPDNYRLWMIGNKYGYKVTRTCLIRDGVVVGNPVTELLTPMPLRPMPLLEWETLSENDDYAGVAAEAIYGDGFEVDPGSVGIIDIINKATEQESRYGFALLAADLSREVALASGLMYIDKEAVKGEKYIYKVFPAQIPEGLKVDTAYFFTGVDEYQPLPPPINFKAESGDRSITLTWDAISQEGLFTAFWMERSGDGGETFDRLDSSPVINTTPEGYDESRFHYYMDTIADNSKVYHYRVRGITPFGEVSPPSAIVKTKGKNEISSVPRITLAESFDGNTLSLEWDLELLEGEVVEGLRLYRSHKFESEYELVADSISVIQRRFVDTKPLPTGYYRMQAFNTDGVGPFGTPKMVQMVDSIPPVPPVGLSAKADTSGLVVLSWKPNEELDLFGYRVFRANSLREEFSQITVESVYSNSYSDTISLHTLSKKVYYKILAVDQRQNWSEFSAILEVDRPDIVPPAPPRLGSVNSVIEGIEVNWVLSPSPDVEQQLLYRNSESNRQWMLVKSFNKQAIQYTDTTVMPNVLYRYLLVVVDGAGNESKPTKFSSQRFEPSLELGWIEPVIRRDSKSNRVLVSWASSIGSYRIYRRLDGMPWEIIAVVNGDNSYFDDLINIRDEIKVQYLVKSSILE